MPGLLERIATVFADKKHTQTVVGFAKTMPNNEALKAAFDSLRV